MKNDDPEIARRFVRWHRVKTSIEKSAWHKKIKEGGIYWAAVGQNIGAEVYGKNERFTRPVLVFKKLNGEIFLAVPLSSMSQRGTWYISFAHRGVVETAMLHQIKVMSVKRLQKYMGEIDRDDFERVKQGLLKLYFKM